MYAKMIKGRELKMPNAVISKFLIAISKLCPRSGVTARSKRHINTIAKTMYMLIMKLKKEENLRADNDLARLTGKTNTNYMIEYIKICLRAYAKNGSPKSLSNKFPANDVWQIFEYSA